MSFTDTVHQTSMGKDKPKEEFWSWFVEYSLKDRTLIEAGLKSVLPHGDGLIVKVTPLVDAREFKFNVQITVLNELSEETEVLTHNFTWDWSTVRDPVGLRNLDLMVSACARNMSTAFRVRKIPLFSHELLKTVNANKPAAEIMTRQEAWVKFLHVGMTAPPTLASAFTAYFGTAAKSAIASTPAAAKLVIAVNFSIGMDPEINATFGIDIDRADLFNGVGMDKMDRAFVTIYKHILK